MKIKKSIILTIVLVVILGLAGCKEKDVKTSNDESNNEVDLTSVMLRVGNTGWESMNAQLKAAGLDDTPYKVEYSTNQGGNLGLEAMAADQIDFTATSEIPPIYASLAENGGNFKIIAISNSNTQNQELVVQPNSSIKSVAELKGKKVGYIKSTTAQYFLDQMLKEEGLTWDDINAVELTTADGVTALLGGEIDAFASYGNSINAAKNHGATTLASAEDILSGNFPYEASISALADDGKRAAIADYLARLELSNQWIKENVEEWAEISADPTGQTVEENLDLLKRGFAQRKTSVKMIGDEIISSEQLVADTFFEIGLLEAKVDVSTLYDDSLTKDYEAAIKTLRK